jgi:hypothetical protein
MKKEICVFIFLIFAGATHAQYSTSFPATENPISQGGKWISGSAAGTGCFQAGVQCWGDVRTTGGTPGLAFGTSVTGTCGTTNCNDSVAVLSGPWPSNQQACATVGLISSNRDAGAREFEMRLRVTISSQNINGYEINYGEGTILGSTLYGGIVRWNGPQSNFTPLASFSNPQGGSILPLQVGDVFCATATGSTLSATVTRSGTQIATVTTTDSTFTGGSMGIGFFDSFNANDNSFGFSNFSTTTVGGGGGGTTFTAASCNQTDVAAVIAAHPQDGNTFIIPAGSCTWQGPAGIAVPNNIGITITGTGTPNSTPSTSAASASCSSTSITVNFPSPAFTMAPTFGNSLSRISCILFSPGPLYIGSPGHGIAGPLGINGTCAPGGCPDFRIDNTTFLTVWTNRFISDGTMVNVADVFGVADHNTIGDTINTSDYIDFINVGHGLWLGNVAFGDSSWASPDTFGTKQMFYLENNTFSHALGTDSDIPDPSPHGGGARLACRFNTFNNLHPFGACSGHGTETTGRPRGVRQWEGYFNTAICTDTTTQGCNSLWPGRSGVGRSFGNKVSDSGSGRMKTLDVFNAQRSWRGSADFGFCGGLAPWDTNDTNGGGGNTGFVYFTGTVASVSGFTVTVNGTPGWMVNQWAPVGQNFSVIDTTGGSFSAEIESNTANSFTIEFSGSGTNYHVGDTVEITRVFVCLDQSNRGAGVLLNGQHTPNQVQVNQVLDPSYEADDDARGTLGAIGVYFSSAQHREIQNHDWYQENLNQNAQTSATSPFNGTSGTGHGSLALRPTTCTTGVGYWATDQGSWNTSGIAGPRGYTNGVFFLCTATNTWSLNYTPFTYPHPLITGGGGGGAASPPSCAPISGNVPQNVTCTNPNSGTTIMCFAASPTTPATNGSGTACNAGTAYTTTITISSPETLNIIAGVATKTDSSVSSYTYTAPPPTIIFAPTSVNFGSATVGGTPVNQTITISNSVSSFSAITITALIASGSGFSWTPLTCSALPITINVNTSCNIQATFTPVLGTQNGFLTFTDNAVGSAQAIPLTGTGVSAGAPGVQLTPSTLPFPPTGLGSYNGQVNITLKNVGTATLTIVSITIQGANLSDFSGANNCGASVSVNAVCTIGVIFRPQPGAIGLRSASVVMIDNAPGSPHTVPLTGNAVAQPIPLIFVQ